MKAQAMSRLDRTAAPMENHLDPVGLWIKRADLIPPVPTPEGQGAVWPGAVSSWTAAEVVLTFEQADRDTFQAMRTLPWIMSYGHPEVREGVLEGLRQSLGPRACVILLWDAFAWWTREGQQKLGQAVLWSTGP